MKTFSLSPVDAWFFRDGRPYNEKEANQADVTSVFPPPARTLSGALRAALARANGWNGNGPWTPQLNTAFGSSPDDLGHLQFDGPFLLRKASKKENAEALWPLPCHVLGRTIEGIWNPKAFLRPSKELVYCDAGALNLPVIALPPGEKREGLKPSEFAWIKTEALEALLAGRLPKPADILPSSKLWAHEPRVGLRRDEVTLTTGEGALYSPSYVRLCDGVSLGLGISGVPEMMNSPDNLLPFGGESRLAHCTLWSGPLLPEPPAVASFKPDSEGNVSFTVSLLTPGCFESPKLTGASIISACVGKPQFVGGWDSLKREPLPLEPFAPAGSIWFCTASDADFAAIYAQHGSHIGRHSSHGFGHILIGHWPSAQSTSP